MPLLVIGTPMDKWSQHVTKEITDAKDDKFRLLDIMTDITSLDGHNLIPEDISLDLFKHIEIANS